MERLEDYFNAKDKFEVARKLYPGTKRGLLTEFENFQRHKDWKITIGLLEPAIRSQIEHREKLMISGEFCPNWKNFRTWINQRCWEEEMTDPMEMKYKISELRWKKRTII
jgi:hypothetical protein